MASFILPVTNRLAQGATVQASLYDSSTGKPSGVVVDTQVMGAVSLTFTGLTEGRTYWAVDQANNSKRELFYVPTVAPVALTADQLDTDPTLAANLDTKIATQKATRSFVLAQEGGSLGFINVKNAPYSAAGDGVADDYAEIQAAINDCAAAGGGIVFLPPGTYKISSTLVMASFVWLLGSGYGSTIIKRSNGDFDMVWLRGSATGFANHIRDPKISDIQFHGNGRTGRVIDCVYASGIVMRDVLMVTNTGVGVDIVETWDSFFDNVAGDAVSSTTDPTFWVRSSRASSGFGQSNDNSNLLRFRGCRAESWKGGAFKVEGGTGAGGSNPVLIWIEHFKAESFFLRAPAFQIAGVHDFVLRDSNATMIGFDSGFSTPQSGISITNGSELVSLRDVVIQNSTATGTMTDGVNCGAAAEVNLDGIHGLYTTAPTTGKHVNLTGGGPYSIRGIENTGATTNVFLASGVYSKTSEYGFLSVASAAALTIPVNCRYAQVSGTANITSIPVTYAGHMVTLQFSGTASSTGLTHGGGGSGTFLLAGAANFVYTPLDTISLVCDGSSWIEMSRSANS